MANDGGSSDNRRDRFVPAIPVNAIYQINPPRTWTAIGSRSRARYQHSVRFASGRYSGSRQPTIGAKSRSKICNILFARELARPAARHRRDGELPTSWFRGHALWRPKRRLDFSPLLVRQVFRNITCKRRGNHHLSCVCAEVAETRGQYFYKYLPIASSSLALGGRLASMLWQRSAALAEPRMAGD
jgi:hypothetical protein